MEFTDIETTWVREHKNIQFKIDIQIFAKTFDSKFHIDCLFDSYEININNKHKRFFFIDHMQLRNILKQK